MSCLIATITKEKGLVANITNISKPLVGYCNLYCSIDIVWEDFLVVGEPLIGSDGMKYTVKKKTFIK